MKQKKFQQDWRVTNPGLHILYVKTACVHLTQIHKAIKKFESYSNTNMWAIVEALEAERAKLIKNNAAYHDASEILQSVAAVK